MVLLIVIGVLLFSIAPFTVMDQLQSFLSQAHEIITNQNSQEDADKPKLEVDVKENSSYWKRTGAGNSPELVSDLAISVVNLNGISAENVKIITKVDGESIKTEAVTLLKASETYKSSITVNTSYKSANIVTVEASCAFSSASKTVILNADLSRSFSENMCCSFVTPNDKTVLELKTIILEDKTPVTLNWMAFRDWIGNNVEYTSDYEVHGEDEYWQFPNETIQLKTGDCEDFSVLLCSLLRADGWSSDEVFVVFGEKAGQYHAWVRLIWNDIQYNIEPQGNGFAIAMGDVLSLSGYNAKYYFNDAKVGSFE